MLDIITSVATSIRQCHRGGATMAELGSKVGRVTNNRACPIRFDFFIHKKFTYYSRKIEQLFQKNKPLGS
jgi:hypothetical protein